MPTNSRISCMKRTSSWISLAYCLVWLLWFFACFGLQNRHTMIAVAFRGYRRNHEVWPCRHEGFGSAGSTTWNRKCSFRCQGQTQPAVQTQVRRGWTSFLMLKPRVYLSCSNLIPISPPLPLHPPLPRLGTNPLLLVLLQSKPTAIDEALTSLYPLPSQGIHSRKT